MQPLALGFINSRGSVTSKAILLIDRGRFEWHWVLYCWWCLVWSKSAQTKSLFHARSGLSPARSDSLGVSLGCHGYSGDSKRLSAVCRDWINPRRSDNKMWNVKYEFSIIFTHGSFGRLHVAWRAQHWSGLQDARPTRTDSFFPNSQMCTLQWECKVPGLSCKKMRRRCGHLLLHWTSPNFKIGYF